MHLIALYITGNDEYGRTLRRALMRYLNLSLILVLRSISSAVKKRFPTLDHVVDSGKVFFQLNIILTHIYSQNIYIYKFIYFEERLTKTYDMKIIKNFYKNKNKINLN